MDAPGQFLLTGSAVPADDAERHTGAGRDGRWGAIEVKLGQGQVEAAAAGLLRFRQQIDSRRTGEPAFLAVVCGSGYG